MAKVPDSNKSESWTVRIPNDLAELARSKAIGSGLLKLGGKPNTTLIIHAALKVWLELPNDMSNTVSNMTSNDLSNSVIQDLQYRLDELSNVISNAVRRDELVSIETRLKEVESLIADLVDTQAVDIPAAETAFVGIAIPETIHNQLNLTDIPEVEDLGTTVPVLEPETIPDTHPYPVGTELRFKDLSEHLGFNLINYSTYAKKQCITSDEYINQKAIAKGERWEITTVGTKKIAIRIS